MNKCHRRCIRKGITKKEYLEFRRKISESSKYKNQ